MDELIGVHEIEVEHGINRMQVRRLLVAGEFPHPVAELAAGRVWRRRDVDKAVARLVEEGRVSDGMLLPRKFLAVKP